MDNNKIDGKNLQKDHSLILFRSPEPSDNPWKHHEAQRTSARGGN